MDLLLKQQRINRGSKNDKETVNNAVAFEILRQIADYPFDLFKIRVKSVVNLLLNVANSYQLVKRKRPNQYRHSEVCAVYGASYPTAFHVTSP